MTTNQPDRLERIEAAIERQVQVNAELASAINSLVNTVNQHQENFMVLVREIRDIRADMQVMQANMQVMQTEIRGLQTENRRILERLERQDRGD
jgi:chromosome segregation ATPase